MGHVRRDSRGTGCGVRGIRSPPAWTATSRRSTPDKLGQLRASRCLSPRSFSRTFAPVPNTRCITLWDYWPSRHSQHGGHRDRPQRPPSPFCWDRAVLRQPVCSHADWRNPHGEGSANRRHGVSRRLGGTRGRVLFRPAQSMSDSHGRGSYTRREYCKLQTGYCKLESRLTVFSLQFAVCKMKKSPIHSLGFIVGNRTVAARLPSAPGLWSG